jgi:hypothetical protein
MTPCSLVGRHPEDGGSRFLWLHFVITQTSIKKIIVKVKHQNAEVMKRKIGWWNSYELHLGRKNMIMACRKDISYHSSRGTEKTVWRCVSWLFLLELDLIVTCRPESSACRINKRSVIWYRWRCGWNGDVTFVSQTVVPNVCMKLLVIQSTNRHTYWMGSFKETPVKWDLFIGLWK